MSTGLARYDAACRAIAEARTVDEVKDIRDQAAAMAHYARQAKNRDLEANAVEIRLRATRRLAEMIEAQKQTAAADCALVLWIVWSQLTGALEVIKACGGLEYKTCGFTWVKTKKNADSIKLDGEGLHNGLSLSGTEANTEVCLLATRGSPLRLAKDVHQVVIAPAGEQHSEKPDEVYRRIERLYPGPYLELFARRPRDGWTTWGNELRPPGEAWREMWARPFDYSKLDGDAS